MRVMKDKERLFIVIKIFLHLHGPATAREIVDYINQCPVNFAMLLTPIKVGTLLRGNPQIKKVGKKKPQVYAVET